MQQHRTEALCAEGQRQAAGAPKGRQERNTLGECTAGFFLSQLEHRATEGSWSQPADASGSSIHQGSVHCDKPKSESSLPAASIEAEAMWAYGTLQPAARQESP